MQVIAWNLHNTSADCMSISSQAMVACQLYSVTQAAIQLQWPLIGNMLYSYTE
jgi:hypothetical protein